MAADDRNRMAIREVKTTREIIWSLSFFFSSRRRHTRCGRDWSSDVCSSDLPTRGMDRAHKDALAARISELPAAMVATHDTEFAAAFADRVVLLGEGEVIADGPPAEVLGGGWHFSTDVTPATDGAALLPAEGVSLLAMEPAR